MFELGWVGEYIPQNVQENTFLNEKLESDTYGIYYSVQFEGDAETYLIQAKKPPVEGETEYGKIVMSKSGKSRRFQRVKREEASTHSSSSKSPSDGYLKDMSNTPILMYNGSLNYAKESGLNLITDKEDRRIYLEYVKDITDEMLREIDNIRSGTQQDASARSPEPFKAQPKAAAEPIQEKLQKGFGKAVTANEASKFREVYDDDSE